MKCPSCGAVMTPIIIPHYSSILLWECQRCQMRYDARTAKIILPKEVGNK